MKQNIILQLRGKLGKLGKRKNKKSKARKGKQSKNTTDKSQTTRIMGKLIKERKRKRVAKEINGRDTKQLIYLQSRQRS